MVMVPLQHLNNDINQLEMEYEYNDYDYVSLSGISICICNNYNIY